MQGKIINKMQDKNILGFSKLSKSEKIDWVVKNYFNNDKNALITLKKYWNTDIGLQNIHDEFVENAISNFYIPFGVAPNFLINGQYYTLPMAIEESSVVAAASNAAKYWSERGGFKAEVISEEKIGQVHFIFKGKAEKLKAFFKKKKVILLEKTKEITKNMRLRGGGITKFELKEKTAIIPNYYQLHLNFKTADAMGANFINSCLEILANSLKEEAKKYISFSSEEKDIEIIMGILSNYTPNCLVKASVRCAIGSLENKKGLGAVAFAEKFVRAVEIAEKRSV